MKRWRSLRLVGALLPLTLSLSGCHSATQQPQITKANFGSPGQPVPPGWSAMMQKMRAKQAAQSEARAAQANPTETLTK
jgi:hypothetical protein